MHCDPPLHRISCSEEEINKALFTLGVAAVAPSSFTSTGMPSHSAVKTMDGAFRTRVPDVHHFHVHLCEKVLTFAMLTHTRGRSRLRLAQFVHVTGPRAPHGIICFKSRQLSAETDVAFPIVFSGSAFTGSEGRINPHSGAAIAREKSELQRNGASSGFVRISKATACKCFCNVALHLSLVRLVLGIVNTLSSTNGRKPSEHL